MNKLHWKEIIKELKNELKYLEKSVDSYTDEADIRSTWNEDISDNLKSILRIITELI